VLHAFHTVLEPFETATRALEGDGLTLPRVPGEVAKLLAALGKLKADGTRIVRTLAARFLDSTEKRLGKIHHLPGVDEGVRALVRHKLVELAEERCEPAAAARSMFAGEMGPGAALRRLFERMDKSLNTDEKRKPYLAQEEALLLWRDPLAQQLGPLLQSIWSIPASQASAERLFSGLGFQQSRSPNRSAGNLERWALLREAAHDPQFNLASLPHLPPAKQDNDDKSDARVIVVE